jgi:hypothetical protein
VRGVRGVRGTAEQYRDMPVLTVLGYAHVRKYREGIEDWVAAGLPTESA